MSGYWSQTNRPAAGTAATVTQTAPTGAVAAGGVLRIRGLQASLSGANAGADVLQITDGATVIWNQDFSIAANGTAAIDFQNLDIRSGTPGNSLVVAFASGVGGDREDVNVQGDYVPIGYPMYQS